MTVAVSDTTGELIRTDEPIFECWSYSNEQKWAWRFKQYNSEVSFCVERFGFDSEEAARENFRLFQNGVDNPREVI